MGNNYKQLDCLNKHKDTVLDIIGNKLFGSRMEGKATKIDEFTSRIDSFSYFRLSLLYFSNAHLKPMFKADELASIMKGAFQSQHTTC